MDAQGWGYGSEASRQGEPDQGESQCEWFSARLLSLGVQVLEAGDHASKSGAIRLLLETEDPTLLSRIVTTATSEPPESSQFKSYLAHIDKLLLLPRRPDYRWLLYLYCHSPAAVFEWARLPAGQIPTAVASPSRLVEWVVASWNLWKEESQKGAATADERLAIRDLGVKMTRTAVAQVPVSLCGHKVSQYR